MNNQKIKDAGNDSRPEHEENPTQPSTSTVTSTSMSEQTEVSQVYDSKYVATKGRNLNFQHHTMDKLQLHD